MPRALMRLRLRKKLLQKAWVKMLLPDSRVNIFDATQIAGPGGLLPAHTVGGVCELRSCVRN